MLRKFRPPNALLMGTPGEKGMEEQEQEAQKPKANWRKRGPKPRPKAELRRHPVTCRVTDAELAEIDDRRPEGMTRGEWLRTAALRRAPARVPEVNQEAWGHAGRIAGGLTTLAKAAAEGRTVGVDPNAIEELRLALAEVRRLMKGGK